MGWEAPLGAAGATEMVTGPSICFSGIASATQLYKKEMAKILVCILN
jgi:hypothetical protein